ncbi:MAG: cytochrome c [Gemmatimonadota bacterium]
MRTRRLWPLMVAVATACTGGDQDGTEAEIPAVDSTAMAAEAFDPAGFDTVSWESSEAAIARGGVVYSYSCARCHGLKGFGDGGFVRNGEVLTPPSFHQANWEYADDPAALREMIFTGGENGMPHWGLEGLKYRDVDAVARYILENLRAGGGAD